MEQQLRAYANNPPGRLRQRQGEFYPFTDIGPSDSEIQAWLVQLADHIKQSIESGEVPRPSELPETRWEWHARFPELGQFGGRFSQDMPDEFTDHEAAVRDHADSTDRTLVARVVGEIRDAVPLPMS
ncbi:contact-dependent growth inhibition system immunity protein [Streptomyces virginiae]|uniref:contact-dependent growth inhibition system immunity protein n=1 Tax=Streptomyces virginiae TaxID=1961 RepID=UPI00365956F3